MTGERRTTDGTNEPLRAACRFARPLGLAASALLLAATAAPSDRARIASVIDGDTVRLASGERIRIAGIDAPETRRHQARCALEIERGRAAAARARTMLAGRSVAVVPVGRSYDRTVARLALDGRDVATELVRAGVARWWPRGASRPDWCAGDGRAVRSRRR